MGAEREIVPGCASGAGCNVPPLPQVYEKAVRFRDLVMGAGRFARHAVDSQGKSYMDYTPGVDSGTLCRLLDMTTADVERVGHVEAFYRGILQDTVRDYNG